ncbi:hypothetical protein [Criblamydia sequanensis]|uniref:Uncharacterized protein n=1 Tax=Candidatus Criblamydia sequanensis CRIB-18 TaxID=1437425 RepID=A0A090D307_9BACT|nr:hypothetical protein [Criblamydia sequanensis]CDR35110.1 hypothetical protein CSEC_2304 [Criblamydia sequanensis CRIB-18]
METFDPSGIKASAPREENEPLLKENEPLLQELPKTPLQTASLKVASFFKEQKARLSTKASESFAWGLRYLSLYKREEGRIEKIAKSGKDAEARKSVEQIGLKGLAEPANDEQKEKEALKGKLIEKSFLLDEDHFFGTESIVRQSPIPLIINSHEATLAHLSDEIAHGRLSSNDEKVQSLIAYHSKALANAKELVEVGIDWSSSNYFRDLLAAHPDKSYEEVMDLYLSTPINLRFHSYDDESSNRTGFFRIGVITDLSNGWTNLEELKEFKEGKKTEELNARIADLAIRKQPLNEKLAKLEKSYEKLLDRQKEALKEYESLTEGKKQEKLGEKIISLQKNIHRAGLSIKVLKHQIGSLDYAQKELSNIPKTLEKRRNILQDQFLILLSSQIKEHRHTISSLNTGDPFLFAHLSLLNKDLKIHDKSGWMHDEENEMLDMQAIFQEFKGKTIHFEDINGPFIDKEGNIHLPKTLLDSKKAPASLQLNPAFFNVSVQRSVINNPLQRKINDQGLKDLEAHFKMMQKKPENYFKHLETIKTVLSRKKLRHQDAGEITFNLLKINNILSLNCLSAKDRTGLVAATVIHDLLSERVNESKSLSPKIKKRFLKKEAQEMVAKDSPSVQAVEDNTGDTVLKCCLLFFPKVTLPNRALYSLKQGIVAISGKKKAPHITVKH